MNFKFTSYKSISMLVIAVVTSYAINQATHRCIPSNFPDCPIIRDYILWFIVPAAIVYTIWSIIEK